MMLGLGASSAGLEHLLGAAGTKELLGKGTPVHGVFWGRAVTGVGGAGPRLMLCCVSPQLGSAHGLSQAELGAQTTGPPQHCGLSAKNDAPCRKRRGCRCGPGSCCPCGCCCQWAAVQSCPSAGCLSVCHCAALQPGGSGCSHPRLPGPFPHLARLASFVEGDK